MGLALGLCCAASPAAQIDVLEIGHERSRYRMTLAARLDAPLAASSAVLRDFRLLPQINDAIEIMEPLVGAPAGATRLYTRVRVCVWFFCKRLEQIQDIRETAAPTATGLDADVLPALSNLRYGHARWRMRDCGTQTCLHFEAELEPGFWVPPVIGPWAIERAMRREALETSHGIERLARERSRR